MTRMIVSRPVQIAGMTCASSAVALVWALTGMVRPNLEVSKATVPLPTPTSSAAPADTASDELIESGADGDPFSPTRTRPPVRYGEPVQSPAAAPAAPPADPIRLVGTVVQPSGGSFVLCQLGTSAARVVRIGQTLGSYQLRSISQGVAVFVASDGQRLELRVPKAGS